MNLLPDNYVFKTDPFEHQRKGFLLSCTAIYYALLMEMGTGKTKVGIDTTAFLFENNKVNGLLVLAPKSICRNWADKEIPTHLPERIVRKTVLWGSSSVKLDQRLETIAIPQTGVLHVLVMNIEAITTDRGLQEAAKFLRSHNVMMIIDESTIIKNHKAVRTKVAIKLGLLAKYRRIMTGTPVTQSPLDVYAQFEFLQSKSLGSSSYFGFRNQYAILQKRYVNGRTFDQVVGYQRLNELQTAIQSHSYRVLKKDCLDLPDKIYEVRYIELTPEQKRYYEELRENAISTLGNGQTIATPLMLTCLLRLRQALCNIAPIQQTEDDPHTVPMTQPISMKDNRLEEVMNILAEAGDQKVIIWANFRSSIENLRAAIEKEYGEGTVGCIHGDVSQEQRQEFVYNFQDDSNKLRFMVAQPRTGGYGLTLTAATLVIYHDNDWSLEVRQQSEDRAHRIGQKHAVTYIDLIAPNTIDEKIRSALVEKRDLADKVTGDKLLEMLK
jgi:SNF2 family DNA or RNA helicase